MHIPSKNSLLRIVVFAATSLAFFAPATTLGADESGIYGTVSGPGGQPLPGICVTARGTDIHAADDETKTGADGTYAMNKVTEGYGYKVHFYDCRPGDSNLLEQWFDDRGSEKSAEIVPVAFGAPTNGIDAKLRQGGSVTGTVTDDGGAPLDNITVEVKGNNSRSSASVDGSGHYEVDGLRTGVYLVRFSSSKPSFGYFPNYQNYPNPNPEYYDDASSMDEATEVSVVEGEATTAVNSRLAYIKGAYFKERRHGKFGVLVSARTQESVKVEFFGRVGIKPIHQPWKTYEFGRTVKMIPAGAKKVVRMQPPRHLKRTILRATRTSSTKFGVSGYAVFTDRQGTVWPQLNDR